MCKVSIYILWKCWCQHQPWSLPNDSCFWFNTGFYVGKNTKHCVRHKCCGIKYYRYDDVTIWDVELGTLNDFKTMGKYFLNLTSRYQNKTVFYTIRPLQTPPRGVRLTWNVSCNSTDYSLWNPRIVFRSFVLNLYLLQIKFISLSATLRPCWYV